MSQENKKEVVIVESVSPEVIYQQDKAQIDVQISTAKAFPRNVTRSIENSIAIVTMDQATASTCNYTVPRGGKQISGPSVHLAKIIAQNWGNLRIETKVVNIDKTHVTSQAIAFDLENNLAIKVEVKRSIIGKYGTYSTDMITVTGNASNAIALRNAVFGVVPRAIVDKVYQASKNKITGDLSNKQQLLKKRKQVFDLLKDNYNVTEKEALNTVGKASIDNIVPDDLLNIIGIVQAIKDGDTDVKTAFKKRTRKTTKDVVEQKKNLRNKKILP